MKNITKVLSIVMALIVALSAFVGCQFACVHEGGVATCSEAGYCTLCGEAYIAALGHKTAFTEAVEATCTTAGATAGSYCETCGEVFVAANEIPALGHTMVSEGTFDEENYENFACSVCGETAKEKVQLPGAVVTPIENENLTFALNFGIKGVSLVDGEIVLDPAVISDAYLEALFNEYGSYYVDYVLTIEGLTSEGVSFNANGDADGYLGGQYDAWSSNWVYVPFEDATIPNNGSLYIMETAAEMMGQSGLRYTLAEIATVVVDFDCGVYFTPEFLAANPDMVVTLELVLFTEDADGNITDSHVLAENVFTVPVADAE